MGIIDLSTDSLEIGSDSVPTGTHVEGNYKYVTYTGGRALVYKGDSKEPSYEITPAGCSCPAAKYRSDICKHRKYVLGLGDSSSGNPQDVEPKSNATGPEIDLMDSEIEDMFG